MEAVRIHSFGSLDMISVEDVPIPTPGLGEVLVRVAASGVAPWDEIIREGKSKVSPQPPLTLGSDLAGVIERVGDGVAEFHAGDAVYGVTNPGFVGAQAEYAVCEAGMISLKPPSLSMLEAASAPVIAVTAWQMLFEYAKVKSGDIVLIVGAAGNVGAYAVKMAVSAGIGVVAVAHGKDEAMLRHLGVAQVIDSDAQGFERGLPQLDAILDLVGGETLARCLDALRPGGKLVSVVTQYAPPPARQDVQSAFFYAEVTTDRLRVLTDMFESGKISARVGSVLPLDQARLAHEMLSGAPHKPGKILLEVS